MHDCSQLFRTAFDAHPNPYVAGLDGSLTSTGVYLKALVTGDDYHYHIPTDSKFGTDPQRIDHIVDIVLHDLTIPLYPVIAVCIEDYGPITKFAGKLLERAEIVGSIKRGLRAAGIPYYTVSPNGLKKFATGHGGTRKGENAKQAVMQSALAFGFDTQISDEADAFWLADLMSAIVSGKKHGIDVTRVNAKGS